MKDFRVIFTNDLAKGMDMSESTRIEQFEIGPEIGSTIKLFRDDRFKEYLVTDTNYEGSNMAGLSVKEVPEDELLDDNKSKGIIQRNPKVLIGIFAIFFVIVGIQTYYSFKNKGTTDAPEVIKQTNELANPLKTIPSVSEKGSAQSQGKKALEKSEEISNNIKSRQ